MNHLKTILLDLMEADQEFISQGPTETFQVLSKANTAWLKIWIAGHGWPRITEIGKEAAQAAWIIVQHSDHDSAFQAHCLHLMEEMRKESPKDVSLPDIATLQDRLLVNAGKPQRFGTQWRREDIKDKLEPLPIEDMEKMHNLRAEYGLIPYEDAAKEYATY